MPFPKNWAGSSSESLLGEGRAAIGRARAEVLSAAARDRRRPSNGTPPIRAGAAQPHGWFVVVSSAGTSMVP